MTQLSERRDTHGQGPLSGVRVIDFTRYLAGPSAAMMMGDMGADVIKVEDLNGDPTRSTGLGDSFGYACNRSKRDICLDVRSKEGKAILRRLVASADVFIQASRPGAQERAGLAYKDLKTVNDRLIYASLSGFGEVGPQSGRGGVDFIIQAESGLMAITGMEGGPPTKAGFQVVDYSAGLALCQAITAALYQRERTGHGERVSVNLLNTALHLQGVQLAEYGIRGEEPARPGNSVAHAAPSDLLYASDGALMLVAYADNHWRALCEVLDNPALTDNPRFARNSDRIAYRQELTEILQAEFSKRRRDEWADLLGAHGILIGQVKGYDDIVGSDHIQATDMLVDAELDDGAHIKLVRTPMDFETATVAMRRPPPALGEHSLEILAELGMSEEEMQGLVEQGIVIQA